MKALEILGRQAAPGNSSVFFAAWCVTLRFAIAAGLLGAWLRSQLLGLTRLETKQGLGLGLFGGLGLLLQMDGMAYTLASTSAFLTQAYCIWLPIWFALRHRRWPPRAAIVSCLMVLLGSTILAGVNWGMFRLGRGEWEALAGSVLFAGQILWLDRAEFRGNHVGRFSMVMFLTMTMTLLPLSLLTARAPGDLLRAYAAPTAIVLLGVVVVVCTLVSFLLANRWQPMVSATQAGLLYATEPVFTAGVALFLPGVISRASGIDYSNERLTPNLLLGGGLIMAANFWVQLRARTNFENENSGSVA